MNYGKQIYSERKKRRITQVRLAKEMGIAMQTLSEIELEKFVIGEPTYRTAVDAMDKIQGITVVDGAA